MFYDVRNNKAVLTLVPKVQGKVNDVLWWCKQNGIEILITDAYRSVLRQNMLYGQGRWYPGSIVTRAKGGWSTHQYGIAIDFVPTDLQGGFHYEDTNRRMQVVNFAKGIGFSWGGDWSSFPDYPHLEYNEGHDITYFRNGGKLSNS